MIKVKSKTNSPPGTFINFTAKALHTQACSPILESPVSSVLTPVLYTLARSPNCGLRIRHALRQFQQLLPLLFSPGLPSSPTSKLPAQGVSPLRSPLSLPRQRVWPPALCPEPHFLQGSEPHTLFTGMSSHEMEIFTLTCQDPAQPSTQREL